MAKKINVFWFRRDFNLFDNHGLFRALSAELDVLPIFIFDKEILEELDHNDSRVDFIHLQLSRINTKLKTHNSSLKIFHGYVEESFQQLISEYEINTVFTNEDYEPYAIKRDKKVADLLLHKGIKFESFKNHVYFSPKEILKKDLKPYTVFTPYKNAWLDKYNHSEPHDSYQSELLLDKMYKSDFPFPSLSQLGFTQGIFTIRDYRMEQVGNYDKFRDFPAEDSTTYLGPHLRFGTVSIRSIINKYGKTNATFLGEIIWREFFIQIMFHFPHVENHNFKAKYDSIKWNNNEKEFALWCEGKTGYPIVDAGMRQLNTTGYMHNRVRMITSSFLVKHLLIDWRWGEAYFASKLLDYELAANNGNWQWAASTGCDAVPYFRIFSPELQTKRFDKNYAYIKHFITDFDEKSYIKPIVQHNFARNRAIQAYKQIQDID